MAIKMTNADIMKIHNDTGKPVLRICGRSEKDVLNDLIDEVDRLSAQSGVAKENGYGFELTLTSFESSLIESNIQTALLDAVGRSQLLFRTVPNRYIGSVSEQAYKKEIKALESILKKVRGLKNDKAEKI